MFKDYDIMIPQTAIDKLKIEKAEDVVVYSIVVVPEDIRKMTANLLGPIIINHKEKLGKQVILDDSRYTTKHFCLTKTSKGGQVICLYLQEKRRIHHFRWKDRNQDYRNRKGKVKIGIEAPGT